MLDQFLAQEKINDAIREAETARLKKYASRSQKNSIRQYITKFACQFEMVKTC